MLKEIAQRYVDYGWSILPADRGTKLPIVKWEEFQERLPTKDEINTWFTRWPDANIGAVTGKISNMTVLDHDILEKPVPCKSRVAAISGSGKRHYFFKYNPLVKTVSKKTTLGFDFRNDGGFIVLSPSLHESGGKYRWLTDFRIPMSVLPDSAIPLDMIKGTTKPPEWIEEALKGMAVGNIDDTLMSILGKMRHDNWSADAAFTLLQPFAIERGATDGHVKDKIQNVWSRYEAKASAVVENEEAETVEKFLENDEKVTWIVPNLIAKNSIGFCVGLPEAQKTWLMMDLAVKAATGGEWCGLFPVARTKTLFIEQERFKGETQRRFRSLLNGVDCGDNLHIKCGSSIKIDLEHSFNAFVRLLEKLRPELVIIDSLVTIHTKEENNRTEIQSVMEKFKALRQQFNCAFFFISHSNKFAFQAAKEGNEPDVSLMAGSIALPAAAETVFMVQKATGGGSTVHHVKSTLSEKIKPFGVVVEDIPNGICVRGVK